MAQRPGAAVAVIAFLCGVAVMREEVREGAKELRSDKAYPQKPMGDAEVGQGTASLQKLQLLVEQHAANRS